jgi:hypothetical protein
MRDPKRLTRRHQQKERTITTLDGQGRFDAIRSGNTGVDRRARLTRLGGSAPAGPARDDGFASFPRSRLSNDSFRLSLI